MLNSEQRDLLVKIAIYQQMGEGADFTLVQSTPYAHLCYPNGVSVECVANDDSFHQLNGWELIDLSRNSSGELTGRLTEYGKFSVFGLPTGKFYGEALPSKLIPNDTLAYEMICDEMSWAKEQLAFHYAETIEAMPLESAPNEIWKNFYLKAFTGAYDVEAKALAKDSKLTASANQAYAKLLEELRKRYAEKAGKLPRRFAGWRSEIDLRLNARKQYWIGVHLRKIREHHERLNASVNRTEKLDLEPSESSRESEEGENRSAVARTSAPASPGTGSGVNWNTGGALPSHANSSSADEPFSRARAGDTSAATEGPSRRFEGRIWKDVEIRVLSDHRIQLIVGDHMETLTYAEFGLEDRRTQRPNLAWETLLYFAKKEGTITSSEIEGNWDKVEKRVQELRKAFRLYFQLEGDPLPYVDGTGYCSKFKIYRALSSDL